MPSRYVRAVGAVGGLGAIAHQIFKNQLTLSQPGWQIMPTTLLYLPPSEFSDFPTALYVHYRALL